MFTLPTLPYPLDALEPIFSRETLEYHYGKHHQAYVDKLNSLIEAGGLSPLIGGTPAISGEGGYFRRNRENRTTLTSLQ